MSRPASGRLAARAPFDGPGLLAFLGSRAVPGVEAFEDGEYRRALRLPAGPAVIGLTPEADGVRCRVWGGSVADVAERVTVLLDLALDPAAIEARLGGDPLIGPLVRAAPGRRVPGAVDGAELAVRAVLGQQVSVAGAATIAGRLAASAGERLPAPVGAVTRLFPSAAALARYQHGLDGGTDVAICEGQIIGASLWDRPGYRQSNRNSLLSLPGLIRVLGVNSRRGVILEQVIHAHRPAGTFWYLAAIGTVLKGPGVGSALLADRLRQVPEHAYLESSNIANVSLYERFGFRVTSELRVTADGPTLYPMLRGAA